MTQATLPKAIQRQVDQAAAAQAAMSQQAPTEPLITDASQLAAPAPAVVDTPPAAPTPPAPPTDNWEQKYRTLQGMFAQKTGELQGTLKQYESQMSNMQRQLDALVQAKPQEKPPGAVADPKDVENFGADMIEMVQRYSERVFQSLAAQFGQKFESAESRLSALEQNLSGVATRTDTTLEQQFYAALNGLVPDWQTVNQDSRWLQWLAETDPIYGADRQAALDHAHANKDVQRVAAVFQAFKAAFPAPKPSSMENQVAPNGAGTEVPMNNAPQAKSVISAKFVEKFYNELAKGRYESNPQDAARIEAEINQAAAEGRIR